MVYWGRVGKMRKRNHDWWLWQGVVVKLENMLAVRLPAPVLF